MINTPHLITTPEFRTHKSIEKTLLLEEAFVQSCLKLDVSVFEPFMNETHVFQNREKYMFLLELEKLFEPYQSKADSYEVRKEEKYCLGCSQGKKVVRFIISSTKDGRNLFDFGFVIDTEQGILKDIYRCIWYDSNSPYTQTGEDLRITPTGLPSITIKDFIGK